MLIDDSFSFIIEESPTNRDTDFVRKKLLTFNELQVGNDNHKILTAFARNKSGQLIAGLLGGTYWSWLHIDYLWVDEESRRNGIGSTLLLAAEKEAVERGCRHSHVETHDFQAPGFYIRNGYEVFANLEDLPPGHTKIFLKKNLHG